jgi:hypothetical protein
MPLDAENEIEFSLRHGWLRHNYSLGGGGALGVAIDQSMCSSILTLPPLLVQEECKHLPVNSVTVS